MGFLGARYVDSQCFIVFKVADLPGRDLNC